MAIFSDQEFATSVQRSKRRLAASRARRSQQQLTAGALLVGLLLLLLLVLYLRRGAPPTPELVLTWPNPKVAQSLPNDSTVVVRPGQPFDVTVKDAPQWTLQWDADGVRNTGPSHSWSPSSATSTLSVECRHVATGARRWFGWLYPAGERRLHGVIAAPLNNLRRRLAPPAGGAWVFPNITASAPLVWDERCLRLLFTTTGLLKAARVAPPYWTLVPAFSGASVPGDQGSYAKLAAIPPAANLEDVMARAARTIAIGSPTASIKFIIRFDVSPPSAILRIAFDGRGQRAAWVRRPGEQAGGPLEWQEPGTAVGPAMPERG